MESVREGVSIQSTGGIILIIVTTSFSFIVKIYEMAGLFGKTNHA
jgi:hypothetical protein